MNRREVVQLHVQLDTRNAQMGASNLLRTLDPIMERLKNFSCWDGSEMIIGLGLLSEGFAGLLAQINTTLTMGALFDVLFAKLDPINESLANIAQWDVSNLSESVGVLSEELDALVAQLHTAPEEGSFFDILLGTLESANGSLTTIAQWDVTGVVESLEMLSEKTAIFATQLGNLQMDSSLLNTFAEITSMLSVLFDVGEKINEAKFVEKLNGTLTGLFKDTLLPSLQKLPELITAAFGGVTIPTVLGAIAVIGALIAIVKVFLENIDYVKERFATLWEDTIAPIGNNIGESLQSMGENLSTLWNDVLVPLGEWLLGTFEPLGYAIMETFLDAFDFIGEDVGTFAEGVFSVLDGLVESITALFTFDEEKSQIGMAKIFDGASKLLDGIISFFVDLYEWFKTMCRRVDNAFSEGIWGTILDGVSWVGSLFGQDWSFGNSIGSSSIPYLAHGAVLPANKPFLAVVGDQKHGTNVEAPLATIQEAVALVMQDQFSGMMAGFEASVGVQKQILQAVLGIEIGDSTIGQAAARYNRKMAVIKGGM